MFENTVAEKKLSDLFEEYVPMSGAANTVGGEIVRAICRIGYRWWNDGDKLGVGYGNETCNFAGRFLAKKCSDEVASAVGSIWGCGSDKVYDAGLHVLEELVLGYLEENPQLFQMENTEDYLDYKEWEDTHYDDDEDWEDEE